MNPSSDSYEGEKYAEPPPAYVSPKKQEGTIKKEKEGFAALGGLPPPNRPIPPLPAEQIRGEPSGVSTGKEQEASVAEDSDYTTGTSVDGIPGTADEVLDISSHYSDNAVPGGDTRIDVAQHTEPPLPTQPLVIDKRMSKLATLPPRLSFHQEGSLEDWSESLFSVIGKRSSVSMGQKSGSAASVKGQRRSTIWVISPPSTTGGTESASVLGSNSLSPETLAPSLPDVSLAANLMLGSYTRSTINAVQEGDEQEVVTEDKAEETSDTPEHDAGEQVVVDIAATAKRVEEVDGSPLAPSIPLLPDAPLGLNVSSLGKDLESPVAIPPSPPESPRRASIDSLPPSPPPKPKPKPTPLVLPATVTLAPPRTNVITGLSGRSPVNSLFGAKPQPLPIPISPSQIRAQLRPAPPKPLHPPPTLPLPPLKRIASQPNFQPPPHQSLPPVPSPRKAFKYDTPVLQASPSDSRPNSSQTLRPIRTNPGDRDSGLSTITVTPATITTAKTELVRTAIASVVDSDTVSLVSRRESVVPVDIEPQTVAHDEPDIGGELPRTQEHGEAPDDSMVSETSSASLLRDGPQSKWPTPPPPPVELGADSTPRRVSRFRTTSLGRVTQLQAMNGTVASPVNSHSSHGSSDTTSSSTSESAPLTTPRGVNGMPPSVAPKTKGSLAPEAKLLSSRTDTFGGVATESEIGEESETRSQPSETPSSKSHTSILAMHPLLAQLQPYITPRHPASCFTNLVEIAEGESGSVFAARVVPSPVGSRSQEQQASVERTILPGTSHVAIKRIPLPPPSSSSSLPDDSLVSNKLVSVLHELCLLKNLDHEHLLLLDAVYVCSNSTRVEDSESANAVDTSLWIRMELMERSLADVIGLVADGLALQERLVGRFAGDVGVRCLLSEKH